MLRGAIVAKRISCSAAAVQIREKVSVPTAKASTRRHPPKRKIPKDKFAALSTEFLDRVQTAMEPLYPPINGDFQLRRDKKDVLVICTSAQEFVIQVQSSEQQIEFVSPVSGLRTYRWNTMTKRWEDEGFRFSKRLSVRIDTRYLQLPDHPSEKLLGRRF